MSSNFLVSTVTNAEIDCACTPTHSQTKDLASLAKKMESSVQQDEKDFYTELRSKYEALEKATNESTINKTEDDLFKVLNSNTTSKRELSPDSISLVIEAIYLGNSNNPNDIYGDILLDYSKKNPNLFRTQLEHLKEKSVKKYTELTLMLKSAETEEKTKSNDP
jgi:hypothetical protein